MSGVDDAFGKRLATPADWAELDDFDEEKVVADMMARVAESMDEAKAEILAEKAQAAGAKQQQQPQPQLPQVSAKTAAAATTAAASKKGGAASAAADVDLAELDD